ncbi:MAG: hypothetical protein ACXIT9_00635 [Nitritalea sp.]
MKNYYHLLLLLLMAACGDGEAELSYTEIPTIEVNETDFTHITLEAYEEILENVPLAIFDLYAVDSLLIVSPYKTPHQFYIYHKETFDSLGAIGLIGEGPGEWPPASTLFNRQTEQDETGQFMWVSNDKIGFIGKIDILQTLAKGDGMPIYSTYIEVSPSKYPYNSIYYVQDDFLLLDRDLFDDSYSILKGLDLNSGQLYASGMFPAVKNITKVSSDVFFGFYPGATLHIPDKNRVLRTNVLMARLDFLSMELIPEFAVVEGENWSDNYYDAREFEEAMVELLQQEEGFVRPSLVQDYIVVLKKFKSLDGDEPKNYELRFYDLDGKPQVRVSLPVALNAYVIDWDKKLLYGSSVREEKVVKIELSPVMRVLGEA